MLTSDFLSVAPVGDTNRVQRAQETLAAQSSDSSLSPGHRSRQRSPEGRWRGKGRMPAHSPHITRLLHFPEVLGFPSWFSPPVLMLSVSLLSSISSLSVPSHRAIGTRGPLHLRAGGASPPLCTASLQHPVGPSLSSHTIALTCGGLCMVCLNRLPELEIFPAPIFWSHALRLQICHLYIL